MYKVNQAVPMERVKRPSHMPLTGLLLLFLLLTACFGGGEQAAQDVAAPEGAVQPTGTLVCSNNCLNQGQCGTAADGRIVILAHSDQPATRDHNTVLANDSTVLLLGQQPRSVIDLAGNISTLNFFAVQLASGGPASWVAGSCVNQTVQQ